MLEMGFVEWFSSWAVGSTSAACMVQNVLLGDVDILGLPSFQHVAAWLLYRKRLGSVLCLLAVEGHCPRAGCVARSD